VLLSKCNAVIICLYFSCCKLRSFFKGKMQGERKCSIEDGMA
jgi:hypothetical protein